MTDVHRNRWIAFMLCGVLAGGLVVGAFAYRTYVANSRTQRITGNEQTLCGVLRKIVTDGDAALGAISYYQHHPAELAQAHIQNRATLRELDCAHLSQGGNP